MDRINTVQDPVCEKQIFSKALSKYVEGGGKKENSIWESNGKFDTGTTIKKMESTNKIPIHLIVLSAMYFTVLLVRKH